MSNPHFCKGSVPSDAYKEAYTECWEAPLHGQPAETAGQMWIGNNECWSRVNFCPYCGEKAAVQMLPEEIR